MSELEILRTALEKIKAGEGYYGAQAAEYKHIATVALVQAKRAALDADQHPLRKRSGGKL